MKESEMWLHKKEIKGLKKYIFESQHLLKKIQIVLAKDGEMVQECLGMTYKKTTKVV